MRGVGKVCVQGMIDRDVRDRSCRLRCSLLLKALLQNWHLYLRSGAIEAFREDGVEAAGGGRTATLAPGILTAKVACSSQEIRVEVRKGDVGFGAYGSDGRC